MSVEFALRDSEAKKESAEVVGTEDVTDRNEGDTAEEAKDATKLGEDRLGGEVGFLWRRDEEATAAAAWAEAGLRVTAAAS